MALAHYQGYVENVSTGKALPDAVIRVYSYPANILQSTFADLASTPKPVVSTDETGAFSFYIADGAYDIEYVYNGDVIDRLVNVPIYNPANFNSVPFGTFGGIFAANETASDARADLAINSAAEFAASGGAALVGTKQTGADAADRALDDKANDIASVADYKFIVDANDTASFTRALAAHMAVYAPAKATPYIVENLDVPSGRTLYGDGPASHLQLPAASIFRVIVSSAKINVTIRDLTLDAGGTGTSIALFTTCSRVTLKDIVATGSASHGIEFDNCGGCKVLGADIYSTGGASSSAAIYLKNPTGNGSANQIKDVTFRLINGRGIHNLGNNFTQISGIHMDSINGEVLLIQDSNGVVMKGIVAIGNEPTSGSLSDGIAIEGGCLYCTLDGFHIANFAGHGVSLGNRSGAVGASYCVVSNGTIVNVDECGVSITDQGLADPPTGNTVTGVTVQNAGRQIANASFNVSGCSHNTFAACRALDTQGAPTTTYGFQENSTGANTAANNTFEGDLIGTFVTRDYTLVSATSSVHEQSAKATITKVTFDGETGSVATIIGTAYNVASVTRNSEGLYTIVTRNPLPTGFVVGGCANVFAGNNQVVLFDVLSTTSFQVQVVASGALANDATRISVWVI